MGDSYSSVFVKLCTFWFGFQLFFSVCQGEMVSSIISYFKYIEFKLGIHRKIYSV